MKKYIIDTEFIRATKERVHFIEVALLDQANGQIIDFHIDAKLNNWEKRYFSRALSGRYGTRTQKVFEAVDVIYSGKFRKDLAVEFCRNLNFEYQYQKLGSVKQLVRPLANTMLFGWDISNDQELFNIISPNNVQLVDVQAMWRQRFGGNQLSLIDAYKHAMYNQQATDERNLIKYAHFASCDVLLVEYVINFIETYQGELIPIPIEKQVRDQKVIEAKQNIISWSNQVAEFETQLNQTYDTTEAQTISRKIIRNKQKMARVSGMIDKLIISNTYEKPWW